MSENAGSDPHRLPVTAGCPRGTLRTTRIGSAPSDGASVAHLGGVGGRPEAAPLLSCLLAGSAAVTPQGQRADHGTLRRPHHRTHSGEPT